ncbi:calcium-binding protein CP1 [Senna tora]|uniref:Calcium-binding protein CP1 n=1 Tax=Senna tora TaxID=362788 RepID=A0A834T0M1_9FABA|nr:calcium-binding protein CP1 [Senna tora]
MLSTFFSNDHNEDDKIYWKHAKDGNFSIKSAYALITMPKTRANASMSWIWKPFCNPRQNFFLWRAFLNALPTSQKINNILRTIPASCNLCNLNQEDLLHSLRDCPSISCIWNQFPLPPNFFSLPLDHWLKTNCSNKINSFKNLPWNTFFIYIYYYIWNNRNQHLFRSKPHLPLSIIKSAINNANEFHFLAKPTPPIAHTNYQLVYWMEPQEHYHKLNIDGSASNMNLGAGGIIRNAQGSHIISFNHFIGRGDSIKAELWALQTRLSIAINLNIKYIEIETNALSVIYLIKNLNLCHLHPFFCVIQNCRRFLSTFEDYKLLHIYREANGCADLLAKHAHISQCQKSTFLEPPPFLHPQLLKNSLHIVLRPAFDVIDTDRDGKISRSDLRSLFHAADEDDDVVVESMMVAADTNGDGFVEYEEFERVVETATGASGAPGIMEEAFRVMDKDGDGKLGREDLKSFMGWAGLAVTEDDIEDMIGVGGGGGVSFHGFIRILGL